MANIVQEAKQKIYHSEVMLYVTPEQVEAAFQKIYIYNNKEEFYSAYGRSDYGGKGLEGFNRSNGSHINLEEATAHTVIHEVMHALSSEFDKDGHRIKNGIMGDKNQAFANQVNEGITDYLSAKISGEKIRHYRQGNLFFERLEPLIIKYTKSPSALMKIYLSNDVAFLEEFLNYYGKGNLHEEIYENLLFMNDEKIHNKMDQVEKNLNKDLARKERREKIQNIINKIKNIFSKKDVKMLPEGTEVAEDTINVHEQFVNRYDIDNFKSDMPVNEQQYIQNNKNRNYENER